MASCTASSVCVVRSAEEWADIELGEGVRLLLGWRGDDGGLEAMPVELKAEVADELREACERTLADLGSRSPKAYSTIGDAAGDEFLSLNIRRDDDDDGDGSDENDDEPGAVPVDLEEMLSAADIVQLSLDAFAATDFLTRDDLFGGGWLFYAVVVEVDDEDESIAFVRQYNPQRGINPGRLLGAYSDALARIDDPVFIFDLAFDVVVASDEVAVLKTTAFQRVFADVNVVASEVPADIGSLRSQLNVGIGAASLDMLTATCQQKLRLAARLKKLARQPHLTLVTRASLRSAIARHGLPRNRFGSSTAVKLADADDVRIFLDVLEKRYYEEDFTGEHMRADNASPRP